MHCLSIRFIDESVDVAVDLLALQVGGQARGQHRFNEVDNHDGDHDDGGDNEVRFEFTHRRNGAGWLNLMAVRLAASGWP